VRAVQLFYWKPWLRTSLIFSLLSSTVVDTILSTELIMAVIFLKAGMRGRYLRGIYWHPSGRFFPQVSAVTLNGEAIQNFLGANSPIDLFHRQAVLGVGHY
jgi:hypothetical protein